MASPWILYISLRTNLFVVGCPAARFCSFFSTETAENTFLHFVVDLGHSESLTCLVDIVDLFFLEWHHWVDDVQHVFVVFGGDGQLAKELLENVAHVLHVAFDFLFVGLSFGALAAPGITTADDLTAVEVSGPFPAVFAFWWHLGLNFIHFLRLLQQLQPQLINLQLTLLRLPHHLLIRQFQLLHFALLFAYIGGGFGEAVVVFLEFFELGG